MNPLFSNVLIEPVKETKSIGGIYLPENAKDKPQRGTVIAVGEDCEKVKAGDKVFYTKWAGSEIKTDKEYVVIKEENILTTYE